jgi:hypothetical protein
VGFDLKGPDIAPHGFDNPSISSEVIFRKLVVDIIQQDKAIQRFTGFLSIAFGLADITCKSYLPDRI